MRKDTDITLTPSMLPDYIWERIYKCIDIGLTYQQIADAFHLNKNSLKAEYYKRRYDPQKTFNK